jgi:hypothetical protein
MVGKTLFALIVGLWCLVWVAGLVILPLYAWATGDLAFTIKGGLMWLVTLTAICLWMEW